METCDYCGRLVETKKWAHEGDVEDICLTCYLWMVSHGEAFSDLKFCFNCAPDDAIRLKDTI